jgi:peptidoglycan/LPS O-acetylase OafA/YrhL
LRWSGAVAVVSALVVGNAIFFLASLNNYLNANEQGNHLIDTQMVWDHAMTTLWWQIIANGALLLAVPRTRRTGIGLLAGAALLFVLFMLLMFSIADQLD